LVSVKTTGGNRLYEETQVEDAAAQGNPEWPGRYAALEGFAFDHDMHQSSGAA